jgi:hypothetical protein
MLPDKELNTTCLRCAAALAPEQRYCAGCGADRELELAVAGELYPAMMTLQRWLAALGVVKIVMAFAVYFSMRRLGAPPGESGVAALLVPALVQAGWMFLLCLVARFLPLGVSLIALALFVADVWPALVSDPVNVLAPGPFLLLRILFLFVLVGAVHAGWTARDLRRRAVDSFPSAVARRRQCRPAAGQENR